MVVHILEHSAILLGEHPGTVVYPPCNKCVLRVVLVLYLHVDYKENVTVPSRHPGPEPEVIVHVPFIDG